LVIKKSEEKIFLDTFSTLKKLYSHEN
jgi:hypothetical protein